MTSAPGAQRSCQLGSLFNSLQIEFCLDGEKLPEERLLKRLVAVIDGSHCSSLVAQTLRAAMNVGLSGTALSAGSGTRFLSRVRVSEQSDHLFRSNPTTSFG